jgi:hypothetical protein
MPKNRPESLYSAFRAVGTSLVIVLSVWPALASAAANPTPTGISLTPFEEQLSLQSTDVVKTFDLTLSNHTGVTQQLNLTTEDFGVSNNNGGIRLEKSSSYAKRYGLAAWMSLAKPSVILASNQSASVAVTISNRSSLTPGGHYGAVVVGINSNPNGSNQVAINQQLLSLVLVNKAGGDHYDLALAKAVPNGNWRQLPTAVQLQFNNPGNIHVVPRGLVKLVGPSGTIIAQGVINGQSAFILPGTNRYLGVPLTTVATAKPWPGPYRVVVQYRYDGISVYSTKRYFIDYINLGSYFVLVIIVILGLGGLWYKRRNRS